MRLPFLNKARKPEQAPIDPRARLAARVEYFHEIVLSTETKALAGIVDASALDRARANLAEAQQALDAFDAARSEAATAADHRAQRGSALREKAERADVAVNAAALALEQALNEAQPIIEEIDRDFSRTFAGHLAPFNDSIVERLKYWARGVTVYHAGMQREAGRFEERLAEYRRLLEPPAPQEVVVVDQRTSEEKEAAARETAKRRRLALENSRIRSIVGPSGAITVGRAQ